MTQILKWNQSEIRKENTYCQIERRLTSPILFVPFGT